MIAKPMAVRDIRVGDMVCNFRSSDNPRPVTKVTPDPEGSGKILFKQEGWTYDAYLSPDDEFWIIRK